MMVYWRLFALCFGLHSASMSHAAMNRLQPEYHSRPIDREAVVRRHFPTVSNITPTSFLALGNGQFGFAVDGTGLQTFNETQSSLCLLSDMHWFTSPYLGPGTDPWTDTMANNVFVELNTTTNIGEQRTVNYPVNCDGDPESSCHWLAVNPVRLDLGQLKFTAAGGDALKRTDIGSVNQSLDTWSGTMHSNWQHVPSKLHVEAQTVVDMDSSTISLSVVTTPPVNTSAITGSLGPAIGAAIAFAMPASGNNGCRDWSRPTDHTTTTVDRSPDGSSMTLRRVIHLEEHLVHCRATGASWASDLQHTHQFLLTPSSATGAWTMSCTFSDPSTPLPAAPAGGWNAEAVVSRTAAEWHRFWRSGAFLDLNAGLVTAPPQQRELERRVVLSQYLMRAQEHGPLPPQETALIHNTWHGKHHQEMRYWHQAWWAMWGRNEALMKSDTWYLDALPNATWYASYQGYDGARWPKATGKPNPRYSNTLPPSHLSNGTAVYWDWPGPISTILIWEQPHMVWIPELEYVGCRVNASRVACENEVLRSLHEVVDATARMMASYLSYNTTEDLYHVGPPVAGAAERNMDCHGLQCQHVSDPTFELTYFRVGLTIANKWRTRLGQSPNATWTRMVLRMAPSPLVPQPSPQPFDRTPGAYVSTSDCDKHSAVVRFKDGLLMTDAGLCLDTANTDPEREFQLLPSPCKPARTQDGSAEVSTQKWTRPDNPANRSTYLHLKSMKDGRCLAVFDGGTGKGVGIWGCGPDRPSGQGWDIDAGANGQVVSRDAGSPVLCLPDVVPPSPQPPPKSPRKLLYNQNRACTGAYTTSPTLCEGTSSHPAVLLALGMLPGDEYGIDRAIMNRTLDEVLATWNLPQAWGWDFGLMAMTAARLERNDAADILMTDTTKNEYLPCGCNAPLLCYLPGNGALLAATSMLANLKAFPDSWDIVAEGFPPTL